MLLLAGQFEDAANRANKALQLEPRNVEGLILKGYALAGLKDLDAAVTQMEAAITTDPSSNARTRASTASERRSLSGA